MYIHLEPTKIHIIVFLPLHLLHLARPRHSSRRWPEQILRDIEESQLQQITQALDASTSQAQHPQNEETVEIMEVMVQNKSSQHYQKQPGFSHDLHVMFTFCMVLLWFCYGFVLHSTFGKTSRNRAASQAVPLQSEALQARQVKSQASHGAEVCD